MGCRQSKIEKEEAVSRCRDRKVLMRTSVSARNAFAAAHSSYSISLKNTGAALSDFAHSHLPPPPSDNPATASSSSAVRRLPPTIPLPPPPPPLPNFSSSASPLQRASTMPEMQLQRPVHAVGPSAAAIPEETPEDVEVETDEKLVRRSGSSTNAPGSSGSARGSGKEKVLPSSTEHDSTWEYFFPSVDSMPRPSLADPVLDKKDRASERVVVAEETAKAVEEKVAAPVVEKKSIMKKSVGGGGEVVAGRKVVVGVNLLQIFIELDELFLKASESAHEVSKMLEATRLHYHSNFADNRGHIDHAAIMMRVITWNRSFKGLPSVGDAIEDFDTEENETHATVMDKMLAWEQKLYEEVKAGELMKLEYQRKVASLNKKKKRGAKPESLEKLKAEVSLLHTRYIVDMQSMDSTVSEINRLRDEQLYPKLVQLVDGMATMWEAMRIHHEAQSKIADALRYVDVSQSPKETTEHHYERTYQLWSVAQEWQKQFGKLLDHQKEYIRALNNWLKLNLIPIESSLKEDVSSPPRIPSPPMESLLITWQDFLDKLPDEVARTAISNFADAIHTILQLQEEEIKLKEKCDATRKEVARKFKQFEDWYNKYMQGRTPEELHPEGAEGNNARDDLVAERQFVVETVKKRLEEEEDAYQRHCVQAREKSLANLKTQLPQLFRAMSNTARACSDMYRNLRSILQRRNARTNT